MKILHVSMGLPPFRVGGLNRYCYDLVQEQVSNGDCVCLIYPGEFSVLKRTSIKQVKHDRIQLYKIINPLPLALVFGVNEPERYCVPCDSNCYLEFLKALMPDVIHVHSVMGIHKEFFENAARIGISMVFTTHDYYPICLRATLLDYDGEICEGPEPYKCATCNIGFGLSRKLEVLMQSILYNKMKYNPIVEKLRKINRQTIEVKSANSGHIPISKDLIEKYRVLIAYYSDIMQTFNIIHCNSKLSEEIYENHFPDLQYRIVSITHAGLVRSFHKRNSLDTLIIGYLGGPSLHKGFTILLDALKQMDQEGIDRWELQLYGGEYSLDYSLDSRIKSLGNYAAHNERTVFNSFDVLVVPSLWQETFGFVVLEALCYGIPVICSDLVGGKFLLENGGVGLVYSAKNACHLKELLVWLNERDNYEVIARKIYDMQLSLDLRQHMREMRDLYSTNNQ